jgi:hypothetical protein
MTLRVVGSDLVHMDEGTFMWIRLTHFAIETAEDDRSLLASLIASPAYAQDYTGSSDFAAVVTGEPAVHGRWWRSSIHPELFTPWTASDAESLIQDWTGNWTYDLDYRPPPAVQRRLQDVYDLLRSGDLYKLDNPGAENEHEFGCVTGGMGFHEFVVIDRNRRSVHVVVASDD